MDLQRIAEFVKGHGFEPRIFEGGVQFDIPGVMVATGDEFVTHHRVHTIEQARAALGY